MQNSHWDYAFNVLGGRMNGYLIRFCGSAVLLGLLAGPALAADTPAPSSFPSLWFSLEAVALAREEEASFPVTAGDDNLTSDALDPQRSDGFEARFAIAQGAFGISARYLDASASESARETDIDTIFTVPTVIIAGAVPADFSNLSDLRSFELNFFWQAHARTRLFAGYRSIDIDETFSGTVGAGLATLAVDLDNRLDGAQIGLETRLAGPTAGPGFFLDVGGNAGLYQLKRSLTGTTAGIGGALPSFGGSDSGVAMAAEVEARLGYALTDMMSVHVGYRLLYVDDIATALGNLQSFNITTGAGSIAGSELIYHGVSAGAALKF